MRNLVRLGVATAGLLALALPAGADSITYNINGSMGAVNNSCANVITFLATSDCSYANTRSTLPPATLVWRGPFAGGRYFPKGTVPVSPTPPELPSDPIQIPDAPINLAFSGTLTIDDNGTPADGSDDLVSASFAFGAADFFTSTGNGDTALERWDSFIHTMAPIQVSAATPLPGGGFEYVIGARGKPTPDPLFIAGNAGDTFPSINALTVTDPPGVWDGTAASSPVASRVGIERSLGFSEGGPQNLGATTTATFTGYECIDTPGDNDCDGVGDPSAQRSSASLFGPNRDKDDDGIDDVDDWSAPFANFNDGRAASPDTNSVPLGPGFSNLLLVITTGNNRIESAEAYWTREYILTNGTKMTGESANQAPKQYIINNSWEANRFTFTGSLCEDTPVAVDDSFTVTQDTTTQLAVLNNDTCGTEPNTITIVGAPDQGGTATPSGNNVQYTPAEFFSGTETFTYRLTDNDGEFSEATVTITVPNKLPVAGNFTASSRDGNPSSAINVLVLPTQLGTGAAGDHEVTATGGAPLGSCAASGAFVTFTPTAGAGDGTAVCTYTVEDADGDTDDGTVTVTVSGNAGGGGGGGGVSGPQLPSGGSSFDLLTLAALLGALPLMRRRRAAR